MEELEYKILNFVIYYIILLFFMVNSNFSFGYICGINSEVRECRMLVNKHMRRVKRSKRISQ